MASEQELPKSWPGQVKSIMPQEYRKAALRKVAERKRLAAKLLEKKGDPYAAEAGYRKAIEIDPNSHAAHRDLSDLLKSRGDLKDDAGFRKADAAYRKSMLLPAAAPQKGGAGKTMLPIDKTASSLHPSHRTWTFG